ncbi:FimV/HubP family polar landmark protein [Veronia pacifica]|uniref:FimV/HubP family polar landmark protein n=1 Tax=Veronia pacifica TaxID=1080227 RepID=UPI000B33A788|nr:FimV/HubP family polar landmark protein [Veronia pacifica]
MSDAEFNTGMKRTFTLKKSGFTSKKVRLSSILVLFLLTAFTAHAEIRIIGPNNESFSGSARNTQPTRSANPDRPLVNVPADGSTTLWAIATRYRPDNSVTIYQTLGAIFRLNPTAFENENIHSLIPGSVLRMPSDSEIRREQTESVVLRLNADEARKAAERQALRSPVSNPTPAVTPAQPEPSTTPRTQNVRSSVTPPKPVASPSSSNQTATAPTPNTQPETPAANDAPGNEDKNTSSEVSKVTTDAATEPEAEIKASTTTPPKPDLSSLKNQIDTNDVEVGRLLESNHILKVRLAEVQGELSALKEKLTYDEELTTEIESFLATQRKLREAAEAEAKEDTWEWLANNPAVLIAMGVLPALVIIAIFAVILYRRSRKEAEPVAEPDGFDDLELPAMTADPDLGLGDTDELVLENDGLDLAAVAQQPMIDQAFNNQQGFDNQQQGFDNQQAFDPNAQPQGFDNMPAPDAFPQPDAMAQPDVMQQPDMNVADNLDMAMADPDLAMNPDLNVAASSDDAIGLEDMEKSLDEMAAPAEEAELSPDEALAAMWEQSLTEGDDAVDDIDALLDGAQGGESAPGQEEPAAETNDALFDNVMEGEPEVDLTQDIDLSLDSPEPEAPISQDASDALIDEMMGGGAAPEPEMPISQDASDALIDEMMGETPSPEPEMSLSAVDSDTDSADATDASIGESDALLDELLDNEHIDENGMPLDMAAVDDAGDLSLPEENINLAGDALLDEMLDGNDFDESELVDQSIDANDLLTDVVDTVPEPEQSVDLSETDALLMSWSETMILIHWQSPRLKPTPWMNLKRLRLHQWLIWGKVMLILVLNLRSL